MALAACLLFDRQTERALRALWGRLEDLGVPTLRSHTHGRHVPHVSYAVVRDGDVDAIHRSVAALPDSGVVKLRFDGLGLFRRGRSWLIPAVASDLARRQELVVAAVTTTGADLHRHYQPGAWMPHCTIAPRVPLPMLPVLAAAVYEVLPLAARADRAALIDSGTGDTWPLPHIP
ncbi:MAG: 2'-5' RNA ligase family protein [Nocardioidaceae bacterium]